MSLTGIITLSAGILAAPSAVPDASPNIEALAEDRRAPVSSAYAFTSNLYDEIKSHTAAISKSSYHHHYTDSPCFVSLAQSTTPILTQPDATTTHLTASSTLAQKRKATASVGKQLKAMTAAIRGATNQINALTAAEKRDLSQVDANVSSDALEKRQAGPAQLAQLVANIILEISGALNGIIGHLGLGESRNLILAIRPR